MCVNPQAQGGVESKEFGFLVRHPGPSMDFYKWALDMKLKVDRRGLRLRRAPDEHPHPPHAREPFQAGRSQS